MNRSRPASQPPTAAPTSSPTAQTQSAASRPSRRLGQSWFWLLVFGLLWCTALSSRSLWLDEAHGAAWKANQTSLADWWHDDIVQPGSTDSQIAGYVFYIWAYAKAFGASEWALRAANLPMVLLGFWLWFSAFPARKPLKWGLAACAVCSPFLWYYLNEARPYAIQAGAGFLLAAALTRLYGAAQRADDSSFDQAQSGSDQRLWLAAFCFGLLVLSATQLLGEIWAGAAVVTALFSLGWKRSLALARAHWLLCLLTLVLLAGMGFYYLWTLKSGSRATLVGSTDLRNFPFILYELLGFGGFGPGRLDIRANGSGVFRPHIVGLVAYAVVMLPVAWAGLKQAKTSLPRRVPVSVVVGFGAASVFLSLVGLHTHFRILGRHFTPLLVPLIAWLGLGLAGLWASGSTLRRAWAVLFVALSLASCLSLRFAPRHAKDDYRGAAAMARTALQAGHTVWWSADQRGAGYYHVPTSTNAVAPGAAQYLMNPEAALLQRLPVPDLVVASKPDVYDTTGSIAQYVRTNHFRLETNLMAFSLWRHDAAVSKP
jgi:hypothetical protein